MGEVVQLPRETGVEAALWEYVRGLAARVEALEAENARLREGAAPADVAMVAALARAFGRKSFTAREAGLRAGKDAGLLAALSEAIGEGASIRSVGRRLARLADLDLGGLRVTREGGQDREGMVWAILPTLRV